MTAIVSHVEVLISAFPM